MKPLKPLQWVGIVLGLIVALYFAYRHLYYFSDISFLGGILLLEVIVASLWKYYQRFFIVLIIAFAWAGMNVPLEGAWTVARWVVLAAGAAVGFIIWTKTPGTPFGSLQLLAFFCICAALVSATVSPLVKIASLKALSLFLLFLYCASGARLAVRGREDRFFHGVLWGSELVVYGSAACYFGLGQAIWGNPNSLGAVMSVAVFPVLLWGWLIADSPKVKGRRLVALLLCTYLVWFSMARAGVVTVMLVTVVFSVCLRQYKLLLKIGALAIVLVAIGGVLAPGTLNRRLGNISDTLLYKGHKEEGLLGSRRTPWEKSITSIKEHPWFGTGYGTSPTGEDSESGFARFSSSSETEREHGSSYMTIAEWVGILGVLPFVALLLATLSNVWKVCAWMRRTNNPRHYSIPVAMVLLAGVVHAGFEDWLFAVGYYLCIYFWAFAFILADLTAQVDQVPAADVVSRAYRSSPAGLGAVVPNR